MRGSTNAQNTNADTLTMSIDIPSASTVSIGWTYKDIVVKAQNGDPVFIIRFYQENNNRVMQAGIVDAAGTHHWVAINSISN